MKGNFAKMSNGELLTLEHLKGATYLASGLVLMTNGRTAHFKEVLPLIEAACTKKSVKVTSAVLRSFLLTRVVAGAFPLTTN